MWTTCQKLLVPVALTTLFVLSCHGQEPAAFEPVVALEMPLREGDPATACLSIAPNASYVAIGDAGGHVEVLDPLGHEVVISRTVRGSKGLPIAALRWLLGGRVLLVICQSGRCEALNIPAKSVIHGFDLPSSPTSVDLLEAENRLLVGGRDGSVVEYQLFPFSQVRTYRPADHVAPVARVAYSLDRASVLASLWYQAPALDPAAAPRGRALDSGLTRWSRSSGSVEVHYATPRGSIGFVQSANHLLLGTDSGRGLRFDYGGQLIAGDQHYEMFSSIRNWYGHSVIIDGYSFGVLVRQDPSGAEVADWKTPEPMAATTVFVHETLPLVLVATGRRRLVAALFHPR